MSISNLMAFWALSISLIMAPGADWAYAITAGLRERALVPAVVGMLCGYLVITFVFAAGVGALIASIPTVLSVLTVLGAGYLLWLGINIITPLSQPTADKKHTSNTGLGWGVRGFIISGMNPDALVLFLILLPQFTNRESEWSISMQITAMGFVQIVNCAVVYFLVGIAARSFIGTRPHVARRVSLFSGAAMIIIALLLIADQFL
ncbi:LysE family translocator [Halomonas sp. ISL-60]|uniref:LysE family translocator n=1 Tax=unclassified Halomonas TaxID=2609666 RepID=UPI0007D9ACF3|nr:MULTISPECIES: LysE family translocator [unclassified Halomonas]MBT2774980.1 LysE family translocator [Halomonas sp. ISL-60]MBT2786994.1 LysE family translocator [Halomonas sp. ISL-106]MBT2798353.1 LysE family translocator [Halomonas sp. ISL-104]MBT2803607.1 LysE family translocator [Halomonas sp. ISL-56]OAL58263.1 lysine transporter LysE [Halomonas sp. ALS9]